jgi:hypothetical protein
MVAVDAFGCSLLDRDPEGLEYLRRAEARGLGNPRWRELSPREVQA